MPISNLICGRMYQNYVNRTLIYIWIFLNNILSKRLQFSNQPHQAQHVDNWKILINMLYPKSNMYIIRMYSPSIINTCLQIRLFVAAEFHFHIKTSHMCVCCVWISICLSSWWARCRPSDICAPHAGFVRTNITQTESYKKRREYIFNLCDMRFCIDFLVLFL